MTNQTTLNEYLQVLVGERLEKLNLVCEMMAFTFENYSLHPALFKKTTFS